MNIKNIYSSFVVVLLLIVSGFLLTFSINHIKNTKTSDSSSLIGQTTLTTVDATSKNDKITSSKFSTDISNSYNPINVSTSNIQENSQTNQTGQQNIQNAAKVSDINFPIN